MRYIFLFLSILFSAFALEDRVIVETKFGKIQGKEYNEAEVFFGIPYADDTLPTMETRFKKPFPVKSWDGIRNAQNRREIFPQVAGRLANIKGIEESEYSENAFYLNIWRPKEIKDEKLPVLIWIHGGGFRSGGASESWYDGNILAKEGNIIVITINYRLGPLGGLFVPDISMGNLAVHDLIAASKWVRENISDFGGNPDEITISGQSVGAFFVQLLSSIKETKGFFKRAIMFSPPAIIELASEAEYNILHKRYMEILGIKDVNELKTISIKRLLDAENILMKEMGDANFGDIPVPFRPMVSADTTKVKNIFSKQNVSNIHVESIMFGTVREEASTFFEPIKNQLETQDVEIANYFKEKFQNKAQKMEIYYKQRRIRHSHYTQMIDAVSDWFFRIPLLNFATHISRVKPTYVYQFNFQSKMEGIHAGHVFDVPFIFGNWESWKQAPMLKGLDCDDMEQMSKRYRSAIVSFIKIGNPNYNNLKLWYTYEKKQEVFIFDEFSSNERTHII